MNFKILYYLGTLILFLGLLWAFLPHAYHNAIIHSGGEKEISHLIHLFQGAIAAILGIIIIEFSNKQINKNLLKKIK